uniref:Uncharacterized protein n=1 Tax=Rhizophora mucronata TaxID=61149 RepID=A0A2P2PDR7_RHIMU
MVSMKSLDDKTKKCDSAML